MASSSSTIGKIKNKNKPSFPTDPVIIFQQIGSKQLIFLGLTDLQGGLHLLKTVSCIDSAHNVPNLKRQPHNYKTYTASSVNLKIRCWTTTLLHIKCSCGSFADLKYQMLWCYVEGTGHVKSPQLVSAGTTATQTDPAPCNCQKLPGTCRTWSSP